MTAFPLFRRRKFRRALTVLGIFLLALPASALLLYVLCPFPEEKLSRYPAQSIVLTDRHGEPMRIRLGADDLDCRPGYTATGNAWIDQAIVAAEDKRFWQHCGVDFLALTRALTQNVTSGRRISGASTLSTQVIRLLEPRRRTLLSKMVEAFRALQLERRLDKSAILSQYLDRAPFGGNIVGIEAAARRYFGKDPAALSLAEAALLAGLPQSPTRFRPDRHPARAKIRQCYVLDRMEICGFITPAQHRAATAEPLFPRSTLYPFQAPHFCAMLGVPTRPGPGGIVRTSLDLNLQRMAESVLSNHLARLPSLRGGAVVILEASTGALRALVGSPDPHSPHAGQVNGATAIRSPGSALKPFAYALAMDSGILTPASVLPDNPLLFRDYQPLNFARTFRGSVTARDALVQSLNLPAIEVERRVGQPRFHRLLHTLGLDTIDRPAEHYGLGLVLGNAGVRLLDLTAAYTVFAANGTLHPPLLLEPPPDAPPPAGNPVFSPAAAWLISDILSGDERAMDTTGHAADVRLPLMAWKTGTSAGFRDAWTLAWNPDWVIGIWLGNPDGTPDPALVGRLAATPIAWDLFRQLYPDNRGPGFIRPPEVRPRNICVESGDLPGPWCPVTVQDWAIHQTTLRTFCPIHAAPPSTLAPVATSPATGESAPPPLRILTPADGSTYRLLPAAAGLNQQIALSAAGGPENEPRHWFVDDVPIGRSHATQPIYWPLVRGTHRIVCAVPSGATATIRLTVE